jgi:GNAT superfamily N-acetyltransferase
VDLSWLDENLTERDAAAVVAVQEAARAVDCPHRPSPDVSSLRAGLRHGWDGDPPTAGLARDGAGRPLGIVDILLPRWDNTHLAWAEVTVDPSARRQGVGRRLFEAALDRVRDAGRTLLIGDAYENAASAGFAKAMGLDQASQQVERAQSLWTLDRARLDREFAAAEPHASDYELVRLPCPVPAELAAGVVAMTAAINDAPTDALDVEDEVFSPDRLRAFEASTEAHGRRLYRVAARHRASGDFGGHTLVGIDGEHPWRGNQFDTSVLRAHRGHRLGTLLKIEMLRWLGECEPQLRTLTTWNAASNAHMIRVNELLGYEVVGKAIGWQRHL